MVFQHKQLASLPNGFACNLCWSPFERNKINMHNKSNFLFNKSNFLGSSHKALFFEILIFTNKTIIVSDDPVVNLRQRTRTQIMQACGFVFPSCSAPRRHVRVQVLEVAIRSWPPCKQADSSRAQQNHFLSFIHHLGFRVLGHHEAIHVNSVERCLLSKLFLLSENDVICWCLRCFARESKLCICQLCWHRCSFPNWHLDHVVRRCRLFDLCTEVASPTVADSKHGLPSHHNLNNE